jgi:DNA-binding MarR family transcriptional regulator
METDFKLRDGWLTEEPVHELATWYYEVCPQTDLLSFEAHLMVLRSYVALSSHSPLEHVAGLSRARYNILRMLYQAPERRLLMGDFAQGMNVSPTNISKLVDTLVADGLVERASHEADKRKTWAYLTEDGMNLVERALPSVAEHVDSIWGCLDDEEKTVLIHLLSKIRLRWMSTNSEKAAKAVRRRAPALSSTLD